MTNHRQQTPMHTSSHDSLMKSLMAHMRVHTHRDRADITYNCRDCTGTRSRGNHLDQRRLALLRRIRPSSCEHRLERGIAADAYTAVHHTPICKSYTHRYTHTNGDERPSIQSLSVGVSLHMTTLQSVRVRDSLSPFPSSIERQRDRQTDMQINIHTKTEGEEIDR